MFGDLKDNVQLHGEVNLSFVLKDVGFGQIRFYNKDTNTLVCDSGCMNKDAVIRVLRLLVQECEIV